MNPTGTDCTAAARLGRDRHRECVVRFRSRSLSRRHPLWRRERHPSSQLPVRRRGTKPAGILVTRRFEQADSSARERPLEPERGENAACHPREASPHLNLMYRIKGNGRKLTERFQTSVRRRCRGQRVRDAYRSALAAGGGYKNRHRNRPDRRDINCCPTLDCKRSTALPTKVLGEGGTCAAGALLIHHRSRIVEKVPQEIYSDMPIKAVVLELVLEARSGSGPSSWAGAGTLASITATSSAASRARAAS